MSQRSIKRRAARAGAGQQKQISGAQRDAAGRVHLELHRDPTNGQPWLSLGAPVFGEAWQNDVALAAASTALGSLGAEPTLEGTVALARSVMAATSRLAEGFLARAPEGSVACKAGCDHCCYQSVGVTPPEALAIHDHLKRTLSGAALEQLRAHVAARFEKTRGLSSSERFSPEHPCIFLEAGRCSVYEVRPLSCRGMNSLDAEECKKRLTDPEARAAFLKDGAGSRSYVEPIRAFHAVSAGLQLGLSELYELDMRALDLIAAMQLLLNGPAATSAAWISGGTAFESARGGDSSGALAPHLSGRLPAPEAPRATAAPPPKSTR